MLKEVLNTFNVIKEALKIDKKLISSYIVSMTHEKSDILEVLFLGKVAGIIDAKNNSMISDLNIVPLYETINDLNNASSLLKDLIQDEERCYRRKMFLLFTKSFQRTLTHHKQ